MGSGQYWFATLTENEAQKMAASYPMTLETQQSSKV
jgi:hypothetical protein